MAEKADTVSLPPTYAPSDTYTESPPPAYRRPGMAAIRVARLVCCTLIAMTFIVGFFVISHKWIQTRSCDCQAQREASALQAAALLGAPSFDLNNNRIEEDISMKEVEAALRHDSDSSEVTITDNVQLDEQLKKDLRAPASKNDIEEKIEQLTNDLKLSKGLLVGNPKLAQKDVHCKVEKKQQKIADGILSQAIIVTCDDSDDDDEDQDAESEENENRLPLQMSGPRPPLSLLSSIMKILSIRPKMRDVEPDEPPRMIPIARIPQRPHGPIVFPFRPPFPGPSGPGPVVFPIHKVHLKPAFYHHDHEDAPAPPPLILQRPPPEIVQGRSPRMNVLPPLRLIPRPMSVDNKLAPRFPMPFPFPGNGPVRIVRLPQPETEREDLAPEFRDINQDDDREPVAPPMHPLLRLLPPPNRILRFGPLPSPDDHLQNEPHHPAPGDDHRPFPPMHREEQDAHVPNPMPEATGRALPSPVAIPGLRVIRLPFLPQARVFPERNLMTHMEVKAAEEEETEMQQQPIDIVDEEPQVEPLPLEENVEFGPPKIHTLINHEQPPSRREPPAPADSDREPELESFDGPAVARPLPPLFFPHPPLPRFAPEGRVSEHAELNPDAEVIPVDDATPEQVPETRHLVLN